MLPVDGPAHQIWPEFQDIIDKDRASGRGGLEDLPVADARQKMGAALVRWGGPRVPGLRVDDLSLPLAKQHMSVRLYHPDAPRRRPLVIFVHGGGFVLGDVETHDSLAARLARAGSVTVASLEYRRAPEASSGEMLDQCLESVASLRRWAANQDWWSGVIGMAGDSAGATLAWLTTITMHGTMRNSSAGTIGGVLLFYPPLLPSCGTRSWEMMSEGHFLTRSTMRWFWEQFLSGSPMPAELDPLDPPPHVPRVDLIIGSRDPLLDEGLMLGWRLRDLHPRSQTLIIPGAIHGFAGMPAISPRSAALTDDLFAAFGRRLPLAPDSWDGINVPSPRHDALEGTGMR